MLEGLNELILIKGLDKYMEHNKCSNVSRYNNYY